MKNSYKIIFLSLFTIHYSLFAAFSQTAPGIEWQNTIGGNASDFFTCIQQTADGGYISGGYSRSNNFGDKTEDTIGGNDYWIVKTDASGNIQWQNTIGGSLSDVLTSIQQTADGGYILGGHSASDISGDKTENSNGDIDYWIIKTDGSGNIQWQNTLGGSSDDVLTSLQQTADGGYILGGYSLSSISGDKTENSNGLDDYWIVKADGSGNIQWQNTIGGNHNDRLYSIEQTTDGGYIFGGWSSSSISGDKTEYNSGASDYWIVKTDGSGSIQWQNTIGGDLDETFTSIQQTIDGGYILGGYSWSNISGDKTENSNGGTDYWILKTDVSGNIQWQNTIGGTGFDYLNSIQKTQDGGYIMGGSSNSDISGDKTENCLGYNDYWIMKTDLNGNMQWQNTIGGSGGDNFYSIQQTNDGGYICGGFSISNISGDKTENSWNNSFDYWIKLGPDTITSTFNIQYSTFNLQISPNPLTTQSKLTFKNPNKEKFHFTLYDITVRMTENVSTTADEIILTKGSKQPGVYLFNLTNEKTGERWNGKIVIR